jgi:hypothetical protein
MLVLAGLAVATTALSDERALEGSATVFSGGGHPVVGGNYMGITVLGEGLVGQAMTGGNFVLRPGFVPKLKMKLPTAGTEEPVGAPELATRLQGNWPNPFNPSTMVHFELGQSGPATLKVYDVAGRMVRTLVNKQLAAGAHEVSWDGRSEAGRPLASGVYVLEMVSPDYRGRHKMILAR